MEETYSEKLYIDRIILKRPVDSGSYLADIPAVKALAERDFLELRSPVTFFAGENGTGKSTLIEAIAVAFGFNPEGGTKNFSFSSSDNGEEFHSELWRHLTLSKRRFPKDGFFLRAESFFNAASYIDGLDRISCPSPPILPAYGGVSLHKQSHGESFLALVRSRFRGRGLYILDEPEAALSPMRLMELIAHIDRLVSEDSQFIIATHSPMLMAFPNADILELSDNGIRRTDYKNTEHYRVTKRFLDNPEKMLSCLCGSGERK